MKDPLRFSIVKDVPDPGPSTPAVRFFHDMPREVLVELLSGFTFDELISSLFIAEPKIARRLAGCMPWKTLELEPRIDAVVATWLTSPASVRKIQALTRLNRTELTSFKQLFLENVKVAKNVETIQLGSVQLLRNLDLRSHRRLAILDLTLASLDTAMVRDLTSVKAPENLSTLVIRSEHLYSALPRFNLVKELLDTFPGLENLRMAIIYNRAHWENVGDQAMTKFKYLAIAIPAREVHLQFEKFTNLVGLELTLTNRPAPQTRTVVDALRTCRMPSLVVLVLKGLGNFKPMRGVVAFLASISRTCPRLKVIDVETVCREEDSDLRRLAPAEWTDPVVVTDGLEKLDFLSIRHDNPTSWETVKALLEALVPHLDGFYLDVESGDRHGFIRPRSAGRVGHALGNLRDGFRGGFRLVQPTGRSGERAVVTFALSAAFDDPHSYFFKDHPFLEVKPGLC